MQPANHPATLFRSSFTFSKKKSNSKRNGIKKGERDTRLKWVHAERRISALASRDDFPSLVWCVQHHRYSVKSQMIFKFLALLRRMLPVAGDAICCDPLIGTGRRRVTWKIGFCFHFGLFSEASEDDELNHVAEHEETAYAIVWKKSVLRVKR